MIEGKARERSSPVSRSLSNATAEVPFFDHLVANATRNDLIDEIERTREGRVPFVQSLLLFCLCFESEVLFFDFHTYVISTTCLSNFLQSNH